MIHPHRILVAAMPRASQRNPEFPPFFFVLVFQESYLSINSFQSDADLYDTIRPELKIAGQVMLGLKYDHVSGQLEVQVHKATDLFAVDTKKNTSDP